MWGLESDSVMVGWSKYIYNGAPFPFVVVCQSFWNGRKREVCTYSETEGVRNTWPLYRPLLNQSLELLHKEGMHALHYQGEK